MLRSERCNVYICILWRSSVRLCQLSDHSCTFQDYVHISELYYRTYIYAECLKVIFLMSCFQSSESTVLLAYGDRFVYLSLWVCVYHMFCVFFVCNASTWRQGATEARPAISLTNKRQKNWPRKRKFLWNCYTDHLKKFSFATWDWSDQSEVIT